MIYRTSTKMCRYRCCTQGEGWGEGLLLFPSPHLAWSPMSAKPPSDLTHKIKASARIAIVAARFNSHIVEQLLAGCLDQFKTLGVPRSRIDVHHVSGAFELPLAAKLLG